MDARRLEFPDASFDAVLSCVGLPFTNWRRCFAEVYRVLRPGARLAFIEWSERGTPAGRALFALLDELRSRPYPEETARLLEARRALRERLDSDTG